MSLLTTSLSGLMAATTRYTASANNIANSQSTKSANGSGAYVPEEVTSQETSDGGVSTKIQARNPTSRQTNDPGTGSADESGLAQTPNVDLNGELINQTSATYDFQANLTVLRTEQKVQQNLLDIYV